MTYRSAKNGRVLVRCCFRIVLPQYPEETYTMYDTIRRMQEQQQMIRRLAEGPVAELLRNHDALARSVFSSRYSGDVPKKRPRILPLAR